MDRRNAALAGLKDTLENYQPIDKNDPEAVKAQDKRIKRLHDEFNHASDGLEDLQKGLESINLL